MLLNTLDISLEKPEYSGLVVELKTTIDPYEKNWKESLKKDQADLKVAYPPRAIFNTFKGTLQNLASTQWHKITIPSIITSQVKKQGNMPHKQELYQLIKTVPQMADMIELADKDFKSNYKYVWIFKEK